MKGSSDCLPCCLGQGEFALSLCCSAPEIKDSTLKRIRECIREAKALEIPALTAGSVQKIIREETGVLDPFSGIKAASNALVLKEYGRLKKLAGEGPRLLNACALALTGNVIDYGRGDVSFSVDEEVKKSLKGIKDMPEAENLIKAILSAESILYIGDNAGEIVFDRIFIEEIAKHSSARVLYAVKSIPNFNDVTAKDAKDTLLDRVCGIIENGSDTIGTWLPSCSAAFREAFRAADLVISKGQANFETLEGTGENSNLYFLFRIKCEVVAGHTRVPKDANAIISNSTLRNRH